MNNFLILAIEQFLSCLKAEVSLLERMKLPKNPNEIREAIAKLREKQSAISTKIAQIQGICLHEDTDLFHDYGSEYTSQCKICGKCLD